MCALLLVPCLQATGQNRLVIHATWLNSLGIVNLHEGPHAYGALTKCGKPKWRGNLDEETQELRRLKCALRNTSSLAHCPKF